MKLYLGENMHSNPTNGIKSWEFVGGYQLYVNYNIYADMSVRRRRTYPSTMKFNNI